MTPAKRSIANALTVEFKEVVRSRRSPANIPSDTSRRRREGMPLLVEKFQRNLAAALLRRNNADAILGYLCMNPDQL